MKHWLLLLLLLLPVKSAFADGFRCNTKLVMIGDTTSEVKSKCGQPDDIEDIGYVKAKHEYVNLKRYVYDLGAGKFLRILDFHNGVLEKISDGPRS